MAITLSNEARQTIFEALAGICEDEAVSLTARLQAAELLVNEALQAGTRDSKPHERGVQFLTSLVISADPENRVRAADILLRIPRARAKPGA